MFYELDQALQSLLKNPAAPPQLRQAGVDFDPPNKGYTPGNDAINLFLLEVKENRALRDPQPVFEFVGGVYMRKQPPMRVDVTYVVTAWPTSPPMIEKEHNLLAQALGWLNTYQIFPPALLPNQPFPVVLFTAVQDERLSVSEFWNALGISPRAYFFLTATVALDYSPAVQAGPPVTTVMTQAQQIGDQTSHEEQLIIGGIVYDKKGDPVPGAWVRLDPLGWIQFSNDRGQFLFIDPPRGSGYSLQARKAGHGQTNPVFIDIPSINGKYDIRF